jgi:putative FmdB family regulatory protein
MPIYEFRCSACGKRFKRLLGMTAVSAPICCPQCGSSTAERLISRFARVRSEDDALDDIADTVEGMGDEDPKTLRRLMKDMTSALGEDMDDEIEEMIEQDAMGDSSGTESDLE